MDLRAYYQTLRDTEASLETPHCVVVSLGTPDGGKPGVVTEAPSAVAARMIVECSARKATVAEIEAFREREKTARKVAEDAAAASRLQVVVVTATPSQTRPGKDQ